MNNKLDSKIAKAINDLKTALDSLSELNEVERNKVIISVFGAEAVSHIGDTFEIFMKHRKNKKEGK